VLVPAAPDERAARLSASTPTGRPPRRADPPEPAAAECDQGFRGCCALKASRVDFGHTFRKVRRLDEIDASVVSLFSVPFARAFPASLGSPTISSVDTIAPDAATSAPSGCCASDCCGSAAPYAVVNSERPALIGEAFRLEWLTIAWMAIESVVAVSSGIAAGSLVLLAFGLDSVIELLSAAVLVWRLAVELRHGLGTRGTTGQQDRRRLAVRTRCLCCRVRRLGSVVTRRRGVLRSRSGGQPASPASHALSRPAENRAR